MFVLGVNKGGHGGPPLRCRPAWVVIVNPASADGRTGRDWPKNEPLLRRLLPPFTIWTTSGPNQATEMAYRAVDQGYATIAVQGGDGTVNEVVNGLLGHPKFESTSLAILPGGTGADLVRTLGLSHSLTAAAGQAGGNVFRKIDVGLARFLDLNGNPCRRHFLNVTDVGFGGDVVRYVNSHRKRWGGKFSFFRGLLVTLFQYRNKRIRIGLDDRPPFEVQASSIVIANGQYFGGGMWVAPEARMADGFLEVVVVGDVSRLEVLTNTRRLYRGTLSGHPKVQVFSAQTISLESEEEVLIDMDGELVGRLPVRFELLPKKIKIRG
jgi:YegS/Rv2252/BmrU family lipid kinase